MGRTFYVDVTNGNDLNHGRSEHQPWQTLAKVNATPFLPGDRVLFRRGRTWPVSGSALVPSASGASDAPITYGAWGDPSWPKPVIDGLNTLDCFNAIGRSWLALEDLDLFNGLGSGAKFTTCTDVTVNDCEMRNAGNDNLLFITTCRRCTVRGGRYHGARNTPLGVQSTGIEIADGGDTFLIEEPECYGNPVGITTHNHDYGGGNTTLMPTDVTVRRANIHNNTEQAILFLKQASDDRDVNVRYEDCTLADNGDGVRATKSAALSEYPRGLTLAGCAITGSTAYVAWIEGDAVTLERCVLAGGQMVRVTNAKDFSLLNGTLFLKTYANFQMLMLSGARVERATVKRNIFATDDPNTVVIRFEADTMTGAAVDDNLYGQPYPATTSARWAWSGTNLTFANWRATSGQDAASVNADPLFVDRLANDFRLLPGSPAAGAGEDGSDLGALPAVIAGTPVAAAA